MLLLIDNYDSFTYNLFQYLSELGEEVVVVRNDKTTLVEIDQMKPQRIVISPGPSTPLHAGISNEVIRHFGSRLPILGVCLGHQCIVQYFGGEVGHANHVMHGKPSRITHNGTGVFEGLENPLQAGRYHSLCACRLPDCLEVTAEFEGIVMGVQHKSLPIYGVQFHPESILTPTGGKVIENMLQIANNLKNQ